MGIGIIQNHSQYKNICDNYTYHMPAPVCQSKMKQSGDEFVLTENDGDNNLYRNAFTGASTSAAVKGYGS